MRMKVCSGLAVGLMSVTLLVACGDGDEDSSSSQPVTTAAPATSTTLSQIQLDKQKAGRIVLTAADLPGYTEDPPDSDDSDFGEEGAECFKNNALLLRVGEDGDPRGAFSADFSKGEDVTVGSGVTFGETEDEARSAITDISASTFPACFSRLLSAELKKDPTFTNVTATTTKLPAITAGDQSVGYRTVVKTRVAGTNLTINFDFTFVRVGRAVAVLDASSLGTPFPTAERTRLATVLAGRMAAP